MNQESTNTVLRIRKTANFKTVSLTATNDKTLSYKAKGIHTYLISRPDGWGFNLVDLTNRSTDGKDSVMSGLQELRANGYLLINKLIIDGKYSTEWIVTEDPSTLPLPIPPDEEIDEWGKRSTMRETRSGNSESSNPPLSIIERNRIQEVVETNPLPPTRVQEEGGENPSRQKSLTKANGPIKAEGSARSSTEPGDEKNKCSKVDQSSIPKSKTNGSAPPPLKTLTWLTAQWNANKPANCPNVLSVDRNSKRGKSAVKMLRNEVFVENIEDGTFWKKMAISSHLTGENRHQRTAKYADWNPDFEWMVSGDNWSKVLEGKYDPKTGSTLQSKLDARKRMQDQAIQDSIDSGLVQEG